MKKLIFLVVYLCASTIVYSQVYQQWAARYNGSANSFDRGEACVTDADGNVYVAGYVNQASNSTDGIVIKYDRRGTILWTATYNGSSNALDGFFAVAVDANKNVYVTGEVEQSSLERILTIKYNSSGTQQWVATYTATAGRGRFISLVYSSEDSDPDVYIAGYSGVDPTTDYIAIKYNGSGTQQWVSVYNSGDYLDDMVTDGSGNVYVTGFGGSNIKTVKYNSSGTQQWVASYGSGAMGRGIAVDGSGNVYVTGYSGSSYAAFVTIKYNSSGTQQWVASYSSAGSGDASGYDIALYNNSNGDVDVYVTGTSTGASSNFDITTIKYNSSGTQQWASIYAPSNGDDRGLHLAVNSYGIVFITGVATFNGAFDYCTLSYKANGQRRWVKTYNGTGNNDDRTEDIALDQDWNIIVTGFSKGNGSDYDITTVKYAEAVFAYDPGTTENFNGVSMTSTGSAFAVGNNGSIYSTESLGNDWNAQSSGTSRNLNGVHFISPFRGMAAGDSGTILFTTNAGTNWTSQFSGTIFNLRSIYIIDTNVAEAVGNSGVVLRTSNAGANWLPQVSGTLNNLKAVYFTDHNNGYAVGDAATIIHTTNGGLIWLGQSSGLSSTINFKGVFFPSAGKGRVIGTKGNVLNTSDGGTNWSSESTVAGTTDLNGIFFLNSNTGYIVGAAGFVMATTDNGAEWNTQSSDISTHLLSVSYSDENSGVAVGENGTIELTTIGEFTVNATGPLFSSIQNFGSETPLRFKLEQNFPNPFNPLTAIKFALPKDEKVTLSIYDVTGRLVTNLIDGDRKAGEQTVWFNGSSLASGIYIYSIRAGEYAFSRKMVLVK